jgi:CheY-like chemotaxis protein
MSNTVPYGGDLAPPRPGPTLLVIDDVDASAAAIAAMLRDGYAVTVAKSVTEALAELAMAPHGFLACVLDLSLDAPSARLHEALERLDIPVVLVSGVEAEQLPEVAKAHDWRFLAKPFDAPTLIAAVEQVVSASRPPSRRTRTPPKATAAQPGAELTPPDGTPSARPPRAWPEAIEALVDKLTRRLLRGGIAVAMVKLQLAGKMSPEMLVGLSICAVGVEAAVRSVREKKPAVAAAVLIPLLLGAAGRATGVGWLSDASVWVTAIGLPFAGSVLGSRAQ